MEGVYTMVKRKGHTDNNDLQNTAQKTEDSTTRIHKKTLIIGM
jgi:hypothetical protein